MRFIEAKRCVDKEKFWDKPIEMKRRDGAGTKQESGMQKRPHRKSKKALREIRYKRNHPKKQTVDQRYYKRYNRYEVRKTVIAKTQPNPPKPKKSDKKTYPKKMLRAQKEYECCKSNERFYPRIGKAEPFAEEEVGKKQSYPKGFH